VIHGTPDIPLSPLIGQRPNFQRIVALGRTSERSIVTSDKHDIGSSNLAESCKPWLQISKEGAVSGEVTWPVQYVTHTSAYILHLWRPRSHSPPRPIGTTNWQNPTPIGYGAISHLTPPPPPPTGIVFRPARGFQGMKDPKGAHAVGFSISERALIGPRSGATLAADISK
jgi:hypothetical protein